MIDLLGLQKNFILSHLSAGDTAADFTMGNGHDTVFLSQTVGGEGRVFAFDIQEKAIYSARENLRAAGCPENYTLIHDSHHNAAKYIDRPIKAGMFNLGYLPGGDKSVTTKRETTLEALRCAISLMDKDAVLTVAVYPGHAEGEEELQAITAWARALPEDFQAMTRAFLNPARPAPTLFAVQRIR